MRVLRGAPSCRAARRVLAAYLKPHRPFEGSACVRSHYGWTCETVAYGAFPRLASCSRGRARVAAYSTAD